MGKTNLYDEIMRFAIKIIVYRTWVNKMGKEQMHNFEVRIKKLKLKFKILSLIIFFFAITVSNSF